MNLWTSNYCFANKLRVTEIISSVWIIRYIRYSRTYSPDCSKYVKEGIFESPRMIILAYLLITNTKDKPSNKNSNVISACDSECKT